MRKERQAEMETCMECYGNHRSVRLMVGALLLGLWVMPACAQEAKPEWDTTQTRGKTREIQFDTQEGTWMSLDISPDGKSIIFDLLAHIYSCLLYTSPSPRD